MFNPEASCDEEVKSRLAIARQRLGELVPIWKSCTVSNKLKARLIKAHDLAYLHLRLGGMDIEQIYYARM